ncbi:GMC family oxidoreductase [Siccirubricoccus sp. G192]|uniref:GMC family oxidoreductase n=1 Tax=Siccirubricoccus sp. G192 TaxID=2849651 RepID=UPI001C2C8490|nr:GMC family oxidoreductase N-terminal domain-containing protein [Siccirubricoccus sp. G192]MBV1798668.1 GMC family oxidoreductase N-terminal domain-containing protein [Siccirubricoccus sp. G192]
MDTDYLVIGAGSAGCVVASRLSETGARVTLLEAGPRDWYPWIHVPAGMLKLLQNPLVNWNYTTEPEVGSGDRAIRWPRGRVLGGSSSINGMLYVRGNPADFDGWAQMGCRGWSYDDVLPYFRKSEDYAPGDGAFRGKGGVLKVEDYRTILPLTHRFVEAAQQAGHAFRKDLNGAEQEGVGYSQMTRKGRFRGSTARTFLAAAKGQPKLRVETEALATRLLFEGRRCVGAAFRQRGQDRELRVTREVILSGGTVNSPHLLQVSGIGPAAHLREIGVPVLHEIAAVGANLQDHYVARVQHRVRDEISTNQLARGLRLAREVARFAVRGNGALTFGVTTAQVFCRSREGLASPDLQLLFTPASYEAGKFGVLEREAGMTVAVCPVRPDSRGTIMARSADPLERPAIRPNYLAARSDQQVLAAGIRFTRRIFAAPALARHSAQEMMPGPETVSDEDLLGYMREHGTTIYHPVGTCRMGEDPASVVDSRLRLRGIGGLRVIDASVMPTLTTGNTNAPTIMIAEKGAAMIREDAAAA